MTKLTVALFGKSMIDWGGGIDLLRNWANALMLVKGTAAVDPVLLLPQKSLKSLIRDNVKPLKGMAKDFLSLRLPRYYRANTFDIQSIVNSFGNLDGKIPVVEYKDSVSGLMHAFKDVKADILLPVAELPGKTLNIPWIGYIPDTQHRYLPQYFTPVGCRIRDMKIRRMLSEAKVVIVNSQSVAADLHKFYAPFTSKIFTLPFAPLPVESWFIDSWEECRAKYALPSRYFLISNQFWVHKEHATAFRALAEIAASSDVHIVCTGRPGDPRAPDHYEKLLQLLRQHSLESRVHLLGYISKGDQIQIMKKALAVVQPTLFEGGPGGGAVYDAVALGVPVIVSDIAVNLEIDEEGVVFFAAGSVNDLALKMKHLLQETPRPRLSNDCLRYKGRARAERLASTLVEAINSVEKTTC